MLWPAPGWPALLEEGERDLKLIVAARGLGLGEVREWGRSLALRRSGGGTVFPLELQTAEPAAAGDLAGDLAGLQALPGFSGSALTRLGLRLPAYLHAESPRSVRLFDLLAGAEVVRPRSVAVLDGQRRRLRLAFAADLHVAALWDQIGEAIGRWMPELSEMWVDPHRLLGRFVDEANLLAARGELHLVVLGGDLVDHVESSRRGIGSGRRPGTNVDRLLELLAPLEVPTLAIPGNHDHRGFPWRPRLYGLEGVGISHRQTQALLRRAGLLDGWPLRVRDLDALKTSDAAGDPALSSHLRRLAPAVDFTCSLRGLRLVCLSTGCDLLARWRTVHPRRLGLLARGLRTAWYHPDSEGFTARQVVHLRSWLTGGGAALFFHAPLLAGANGNPVEERLGELTPGPQETLAERVRFERRLQRAGARQGVAFNDTGVVLRELARHDGPVVTFSGHVHRESAVVWSRRSAALRTAAVSEVPLADDTVPLLTAPALGHGGQAGDESPGYLLATFDHGRLVALERRRLS